MPAYRFNQIAAIGFALLLMFLSAKSVARAEAPSSGPLRAEFGKLGAAGSVDNLALREDGRYLALAEESNDTVEVWDVAKNASVAKLKTPDPRFLLWRGGTLFVANYEQGTISTFAADNLRPGPTIPAGAKRVCYLSAPEGKAFNAMLLATCNTIGGSTIYAVPTLRGVPRVCGNLSNGIGIATPDGHRIIEQVFHITNSSQLCAYDAAAYLTGRHGEKVPVPDVPGTMFTKDVDAACQPFWFAHGRGYFAEQPARTGQMSLSIPDVTRDVTCMLAPTMLQLRARDSQPMGFYPPLMPAPLKARLTARQRFAVDRHAIDVASNLAERFCQSVAATVDGRLHVFVYVPEERAVYAADFAIAAELPAIPPRTVVVTEGDLPTVRDTFAKAPVPSRSVLSMTLSEDGRYLVAAQFANDHVLVWDVVTGKLIHKVDVPQPIFVLVRRNVIYVCCEGRHAIAAYGLAEECRHLRDFAGPSGSGAQLSAPAGAAFDGTILVNGGNSVYALDTRTGQERLLRQQQYLGAADVDVAGTQVIESECMIPPRCRIFSYADYVKGSIPRINQDSAGSASQLYQARANGPWFNASGELFSAGRLAMIGIHPPPEWHVAVPDQSADQFYAIGFGKVSWRRTDPSLKEFAARQASMPGSSPRPSVRLGGADPGWPYSAGIPPQAVTLGNTIYIFLIDGAGDLYRYETDAAVNGAAVATGTVGSATNAGTAPAIVEAASAGFPARIAEGAAVHVRLNAAGPNPVFAVVKGPPAMQIDSKGNVRWTPGKTDVGTINIKIRVEAGDDVAFQRYQVEVVSADLARRAGGDLSAAADLGTHYVIGRDCYLGPTAEGDGVILLDETSLSVLDADGLAVVRRATLPAVYRKLIERKDHWLAMSGKAIDVLDKKTFAVVRHFPIEADRLLDITANPVRPESYVTRSTSTNVFLQGLSTLIEVDETTWKTRTVPGVYADRVAIDARGTRAFASFGGAYQLLLTAKDWKRPTNAQFPNTVSGGVIAYDPAHDWRALQEGFRKCNGSAGELSGAGLSLSPDGRLLVGIALSDLAANKLPAVDTADVRNARTAYPIGRTLDFSFHPSLSLVAACDEQKVLLCDRDTGDVSERRVDFGNEKLGEIRHVLFAPGSRHLLVHYRSAAGRWIVRAFPLILSSAERQTIALGVRPRPQEPPYARADTAPPPSKIPAREVEALASGAQGPEMTAAAIGRKFIPAVVVIESKEGFGTGFFIGSRGYVLTCAHVLPSVGDGIVRFRTLAAAKELSGTATVIAADRDNDLAVLKIDVPSSVATVRLSRGTDLLAGEPVTVIGNPGLGRTVLQSTLTTGVVSNADRSIIHHSFLQTSAPVNPGNSGGPMFDSRGEVIGVVVLKAHLENTAFAVPPSRILPFLDRFIESKK